jgi:3,4-dihydroxy 2-butanone 4-phosphate synthase
VSAGADLDTALAAIAAGRIVVIAGDRLRGGDIDLMCAARHVTPEAINFLATHGRGLICLAVTPERAAQLGLTLVNPGPSRQTGRPFARSIEAASGVSTGISAADRAHTVRVAMAEGASNADIHSPGHVFPLIAQAGGVLDRPAACEAAIDLARMAGAGDAAVICSIMRDDGEMARIDDIGELIAAHGLAVADIGELIARRASVSRETSQ